MSVQLFVWTKRSEIWVSAPRLPTPWRSCNGRSRALLDFWSLHHGPASSDELSTGPSWTTTEPSDSSLQCRQNCSRRYLKEGKLGGWGIRSFFLGGENGERWINGIFDTNSTNHGLTRFTFCSKSGSSHATCYRNWIKIVKLQENY